MKKIKNKIKNFWKKHKKEIIFTAITVGSFTAGCVITNALKGSKTALDDHDKEGKDILDTLNDAFNKYPSTRKTKLIDEDIFTSLAPEIEDLVLSEGCDEGYLERSYDVDYPKYGDPSEGYYSVTKQVLVKVTDITE